MVFSFQDASSVLFFIVNNDDIVIINSSLNLYINIYISGISSSIMYNNIILIYNK